MPDQPHRQADEQRRQPAQRALAEHRADGAEGQHHQQEVLGRPEPDRVFGHHRREEGDHHGGDGAGDEGADGRGGQRRAGTAVLAILLPSMAVTIEPASPGVFSRIEVVEPPYIAP